MTRVFVQANAETQEFSTEARTLNDFLRTSAFLQNYAPPTGCSWLVNGISVSTAKVLEPGDMITWVPPVGTKATA